MIKTTIRGKDVSEDDIRSWEQEKTDKMARYLSRKTGYSCHARNADVLARWKMGIPEEDMRKSLKPTTDFCEFGTKIAVGLSGKRRKVSEVVFDLDFANVEEIYQAFMDTMLENNEENRFSNLRANPEHFLLKGLPDQKQEVIEISGGVPFASRFIIAYGDETGLTTKPDPAYPFQADGIAQLEDGTVIGGVRHQMKNLDKGCQIKLMVEFPAILPDANIKAHEQHLACEFYNWFSDFEKAISETKKDGKEEEHEQ